MPLGPVYQPCIIQLLSIALPNLPLFKSIYFNCFNELIMCLPVEPQEEPDFPMAKSQVAGGAQPALFPTVCGAHSGSLQGHGAEGVREKN